MSLMLPPGGLVVLLFVLEHRVDVRAVLQDVPELTPGDDVQHAHVTDTDAVCFPTVDPVDEVVEELLGDRLEEPHHCLAVSADQTSIQELKIRVRLEEL